MLRLEKMTVFARFKFERHRPALRVHVWDIFDYANINTATFHDLFESIHEQLCDLHDEQDFELDVCEQQAHSSSDESDGGEVPPSEDSANEHLLEDIERITKFNVLVSEAESIDSGQRVSTIGQVENELEEESDSKSPKDVATNQLDEIDMADLQKFVEKKQLYEAFEQRERIKSLET